MSFFKKLEMTPSRLIRILTVVIVIVFPLYYSLQARQSSPKCSTVNWDKKVDEILNKPTDKRALRYVESFVLGYKYMEKTSFFKDSPKQVETCPEFYSWLEKVKQRTSAIPFFPIDAIIFVGYLIILLLILVNFTIFTYKFGISFSWPHLIQLIPFHIFYIVPSTTLSIFAVTTSLNLTTISLYFLVKRQRLSFSEIPKKEFFIAFDGLCFIIFTLFAIAFSFGSYRNYHEFEVPEVKIIMLHYGIEIFFVLFLTYFILPIGYLMKEKNNIALKFDLSKVFLLSFIFFPVFHHYFIGGLIPNLARFFVLSSTIFTVFSTLPLVTIGANKIQDAFFLKPISWDKIVDTKEVKFLTFRFLKVRAERTMYLPYDQKNKEKLQMFMKENGISFLS